ncbi:MAG: S9 family peptidase [Burkholderiales bacterium]|nr:MAG: S9 family peptidase [Burkholderiales bacterium]
MKILNAWAGLLAGLLLSTTLANAEPPPAELFFKDADIVEAVLSPSGRQLAITSAKGLTRVGLAILDLGPDHKIQRVAQFGDGDVSQVHWVSEDRLIFGIVDLSEGSGRPKGAPGLFGVNTDGKQLRQLVRRMGKPFFTTAGAEERILDWNHVLLGVPAPRPGTPNEEVLIAEWGLDDIHTQSPLWLNTRTGRTRSVSFDQPRNTVGWVVDDRAEPRVAITLNKGRQSAYWRAPGSRDWVQLYDTDLFQTPFQPNSVDSAGNLYVTRNEGTQGLQVLARYDFGAKAPEAKPLVVTPGFDFAGSLITDDSGHVRGVRMTVDGAMTVWFDATLKALQERADRLFPGRMNEISCRRCGEPDMVALVRSSSDRDPGRLWYFQAQPPSGEKPWSALGPVRGDVKPEQMATLDLHRITARDGRELPVWVTRQPDAKGPLPAVVLVHGGPWMRGVSWGWHAMPQFLASRGYVVVEPEFRGSTGYGEAHFKAGFKQWGQAMQDDVADALRWAQKQGLASDKACIAGASYGGYSSLMGLVKDPELYRCGVAWLAVTDVDLLLSGSWWIKDDASSFGRKYALPEMIGDPDKDAALIAANSPLKQAARIKAPLLLAFGEADMRVPLAHGERLRKALREAGNEPAWVSYPGEGHGFAVLKNRLDFAARIESFLARHLQP